MTLLARLIPHYRHSFGYLSTGVQCHTNRIGKLEQVASGYPDVAPVYALRNPWSRPIRPLDGQPHPPTSRVQDIQVAPPILAPNRAQNG